VEVAAGTRRALLQQALSVKRAASAVEDYLDLPLSRHGHQSLIPRMLELRANFSAYDACYIALAERLSGQLLTADERLLRAARKNVAVGVLP
jgi:predicted nucleic acid-binding protein